jgi:hypothetical protein
LVPKEHFRATQLTSRRQALFEGRVHQKWLMTKPTALTFTATQSLLGQSVSQINGLQFLTIYAALTSPSFAVFHDPQGLRIVTRLSLLLECTIWGILALRAPFCSV